MLGFIAGLKRTGNRPWEAGGKLQITVTVYFILISLLCFGKSPACCSYFCIELELHNGHLKEDFLFATHAQNKLVWECNLNMFHFFLHNQCSCANHEKCEWKRSIKAPTTFLAVNAFLRALDFNLFFQEQWRGPYTYRSALVHPSYTHQQLF